MARRINKKKQEEETLVDVVGSVNTLQDYVEENSTKILGVVGILILLIGGFFVWKHMYQMPKEEEASKKMIQAQVKYDQGNYTEALENPGGTASGFLDIIDNYSGTKAGNLANFYAGVSFLNLGKYEAAIEHLNKYKAKDDLSASYKFANLGDAYSELGQKDNALSNYKKATTTNVNDFSTPLHLLKLGMYQESQGSSEDAKSTYQDIVSNYPNSTQAIDAEKFLIRLQ